MTAISKIDIRSLQQILTLAKYNNFHRAAEALFVTQPALTKSIQNIESTLGLPLFDRLPNNVVPTPYCEIIIDHAKSVFFELEKIDHKLENVLKGSIGNLNIGCGRHIGQEMLSNTTAKLMNTHSNVGINLIIEDSNTLLGMLRRGELHFFIAEIQSITNPSGLQIKPFKSTSSGVFCRANHPLTKKNQVRPQDFLKFPLATPPMPEKGLKWLQENAPKGMSSDEYIERILHFSCDSQYVVQQIIQKTNCITIGSDSIFCNLIEKGILSKLKLVNFTDQPSSNPGIVFLNNRSLSTSCKTFISVLADSLQKQS